MLMKKRIYTFIKIQIPTPKAVLQQKDDVRSSGTRCFWATAPQTQTKHWGQTWSTIEGVCISIYTGWNFHQHNTSNRNDQRYRKLWASITKTLSNCHETLSVGKRWNRKATYSQSDLRKLIQLVSTHHSHTKRRQSETFSDWLLSSQQSNKKVHLAYA